MEGSLGLHTDAQLQGVTSSPLAPLGSAAGGKRHFPLISAHVDATAATQARGTDGGVNSAVYVEVEERGHEAVFRK